MSEYQNMVHRFVNAAKFQRNKRVPNLSNDYTWKIIDSNFTHEEAFYSEKKMEKVVCDFHERYQFDGYIDLGTRNHFPQTDALGGGSYILDKKTGSINVKDDPIMQPDEYEAFAKDPMKYFYVLFARKFPNITTQDFVNAEMAFLKSAGYSKDITKKFAEKYQRPLMVSTSASIQSPFEIFHSSFRGMEGISMDLRRNKEALKVAMEAYWNSFVKPSLDRALKTTEKSYVADVYCAIIGHQVLNAKQFEELYWPYLKQIIDATVASGKLIYFFCEDRVMRFSDYFRDIPKGHAFMHLEMDNIFEMRKKLPNMCLVGGMTTDLLGNGKSSECVDYAKKLIDELGDGYIMSQNKMLSFKNDCKRENLLAVNEFIRNYEI